MVEALNDSAKPSAEAKMEVSPLLEVYLKSGKEEKQSADRSPDANLQMELAEAHPRAHLSQSQQHARAVRPNGRPRDAEPDAGQLEMTSPYPSRPEPQPYQDPLSQLFSALTGTARPSYQAQARPSERVEAPARGQPMQLHPESDEEESRHSRKDTKGGKRARVSGRVAQDSAHSEEGSDDEEQVKPRLKDSKTSKRGRAAAQVEQDARVSDDDNQEKAPARRGDSKAGRRARVQHDSAQPAIDSEQALDGMVGYEFWRHAAPEATGYGNKGCAIAVTKALQSMGVRGVKTDLTVTGTTNQMRHMGWKEVPLADAMESGQLYVAVNKETESHVGLGKGNRVWENDSGTGKFATATMAESTLQYSGRAFIVPVKGA
jgi:hypothetical protein